MRGSACTLTPPPAPRAWHDACCLAIFRTTATPPAHSPHPCSPSPPSTGAQRAPDGAVPARRVSPPRPRPLERAVDEQLPGHARLRLRHRGPHPGPGRVWTRHPPGPAQRLRLRHPVTAHPPAGGAAVACLLAAGKRAPPGCGPGCRCMAQPESHLMQACTSPLPTHHLPQLQFNSGVLFLSLRSVMLLHF